MALFVSPSLRDVLSAVFRVCAEAPQELIHYFVGGGALASIGRLFHLIGGSVLESLYYAYFINGGPLDAIEDLWNYILDKLVLAIDSSFLTKLQWGLATFFIIAYLKLAPPTPLIHPSFTPPPPPPPHNLKPSSSPPPPPPPILPLPPPILPLPSYNLPLPLPILPLPPYNLPPPPPPPPPSPAPILPTVPPWHSPSLTPSNPPSLPPPYRWGGGLIVVLLVGTLLCFIIFTRKNSLARIASHFFSSVDSPPLPATPPTPPELTPPPLPSSSLFNRWRRGRSTITVGSPVSNRSPTQAQATNSPLVSSEVPNWGLTIFLYEQLLRATNNFSTSNHLGEGGFGTVYKGVLPDGKIVALKLLKKVNDIDFRTEIDAISRVMHKHIVSLIGYCIHGDSRLIVLEYVENKSLHQHLHGGNNVQVLDWASRWKIALGTAKGLEYLHDGCYPTIIHRDVKPPNILLNNNFEAKVADFGISKICPESFQTYLQTFPAGTIGYLDPEYFHTHNLSVKSDVYSFGIVLLELVTGCRAPLGQDLINKLPKALRKRNFHAIVDPRLQNKYDAREMLLIVACADACIRKMAKDRHPMKKIVQVLEGITPHGELKMKIKRWYW